MGEEVEASPEEEAEDEEEDEEAVHEASRPNPALLSHHANCTTAG